MVDSAPPPPSPPEPPDEDAAPRRSLLQHLLGSAAAAAALTLVLGPGVALATLRVEAPGSASVAAILTLFFAAGLSFLVEERRGSLADVAWRRVVVGALSGLFFMAAWRWATHVADQVSGWEEVAEKLDELVMELVGGCTLGALFGAPLGAAFFVRSRTAARGPEALGWLLAAGGPALLFTWFGGRGGVLVGLLGLFGAGLAPLALAGAARLVRSRDPGPLPPPELDPRPALAVAALVVATAVAITGPHVRPRAERGYGGWSSRRDTLELPGYEVPRSQEDLPSTSGDDVLELVVAMANGLRSSAGRAGASLPELTLQGVDPDPPGRPRLVRLHAPRRVAGEPFYFFGAVIDRHDGTGTEAWAYVDLQRDTQDVMWWSLDRGPTRGLRTVKPVTVTDGMTPRQYPVRPR